MIAGAEERVRQREAAFEVAGRYVAALAVRYPDLIAVVFGSMARGDFHEGSDIDLLLVSEGFTADFMRREAELYEASPGGIDIFGYRPDELRAMIGKNHPTPYWAHREGVVIRNHEAWAGLHSS